MGGAPDWKALLEVVRAISVVDDLDRFGSSVLEALEPVVPYTNASYNEVDPLASRALVIGRPRHPTDDEMVAWQRWAHQNPALMYMLATGDGSAKRLSDFLSNEELHGLEIYDQVYKGLGVEYQVSVALPAPQPLVIGIALNRSDRDFTDDEVLVLNTLRPHLVQAYRNAQLLTESRQTLEAMAGALEEEGRMFHVLGEPPSEPVRRVLASHFEWSGGAAMPGAVAAWAAEERVGLAEGDPLRLRRPLVSDRAGRRLTVRLVSSGRGPDLLSIDDRPAETDAALLQRLGLSDREAEVLWHLMKGHSSRDTARNLNISPATVKKHLEHVYRKLGVSTSVAAVAQAVDALVPPSA